MFSIIIKIAFLFILASAASRSNAQSVNLLVNPGAETGNLNGWDVFGQVPPIVASPSTIPPEHDNGFTAYEGQYYFVGGRNGGGSISQNVYFTDYTDAINAGTASINAGFWEASLNQGSDTDTAKMTVSFFDAGNNIIGQFSSPAVSFANFSRPVITIYGNYEAVIPVPKFAVAANYEISFVLNSGQGSDVDAFVDQTYLSISAIPEPSSFILALAGISFLGITYTRKRRRCASDISA